MLVHGSVALTLTVITLMIKKSYFTVFLTDVCGRWEKRYSELLQNGERAWVFKQRREIGDAEVKTRDANYLTGD